ncbi:hypothetical protein ACFJIY_25115 [Pimelobacter simplex]|uniref:hypothetical protein n=1 Tax=Nocardioides simplex TaxID=2045 RepID=UPI0036718276
MTRDRRRWLRRRRLRGLSRPRPLRRGQVNGQGATASPEKTKGIVLAAVEHADVVTMCEVANIDVADVLGPGWDVAQDTSAWAKAGCAVAIRRSRGYVKRWHLRLGVTAWLRGRRAKQMNDRYVVVAVLKIDPGTRWRWRHKVAAGHAPPKRNWSPWWTVWMRLVRTLAVFDIGADWNRRRPAIADAMPARRIYMHGIDGFALRPWLAADGLTHRDVGGDHPATYLTLWPAPKEHP